IGSWRRSRISQRWLHLGWNTLAIPAMPLGFDVREKRPMPHNTDLDVTPKEVVELASPDAITAFLGKLGYDTADRALLSPEAVGLAGESASTIKRIEQIGRASCRERV